MGWRNMSWGRRFLVILVVIVAAVLVYRNTGPQPGHVLDEARVANRNAASFPAADEDYFQAMDGAIKLTADEVKGRNNWIVWTGGNDRFWDEMVGYTKGNLDLLKILTSYPGMKYSRDNRWKYFGLVNEPCFKKATGPDPKRFGLWLDVRDPACEPDPFENEKKYPGVAVGARGKTVPVGSFYGYGTGIVGLRLFPNPAFDEAAQKAWDPVRFNTDPSYYNNKDLIRPYRVGMSCGFCHVGPDPTRPPADSENPKFENLSSTVGAQYFWVDRIFNWRADDENYIFQLMHTSRPGALDTSLITSDYINNPRTLNAVYEVGARLKLAKELGKETLSKENQNSKQFNDYVQSGPLTSFFEKPDTVWTPHVLKDGSDSVGVLGALNRVFLNIGLFSEEWTLHFRPVVGGEVLTPIRVRDARANSSYWEATEAQTTPLALFLVKAGFPHRLSAAPGGSQYLNDDAAKLDRGKVVFAENCARCHSSKYPEPPADTNPSACKPGEYNTCWNKYWAWTKTDGFKSQMREIVAKPDFLEGNFLSNDRRVPSTLLQTNMCSPLATNAIANHIWDDFSSQTYKDLPSAGSVDVADPITGKPVKFTLPGGGRGFTRPPSLVSLWSTAPFFVNNTLGRFEPEPSVEARMRSFDDSIRQLLWPEKREQDAKFGNTVGGTIDRIQEPTYLIVPQGQLPGAIQSTMGFWSWLAPGVFTDGVKKHGFKGTTTAGGTTVTDVNVAAPLSTFYAGAPVSGAGIAAGSRVVMFDAATKTLTLDRAAMAAGRDVALQTDAPDVGVRIGPLPVGMPINLLAGVELASETPAWPDRIKHTMNLIGGLWNVKGSWVSYATASNPAEKDKALVGLQNELRSLDKCPDYVVNRGHYFGTDQFKEEPGLNDADKEALIAFLKTF
jgi:hypothetical protein